MKIKTLLFIVLTALAVNIISAQTAPKTGQEVLREMLGAIKKVDRLSYTLWSWERLDEGERTQHNRMITYFQKQPLKLYIKNLTPPNEDVEVLYIEGERDGKALVNAKSWLPNLKLDPYGGQLRKDQHHTIFNAGFEYTGGIVSMALARATKEAKSPEEINEVFKNEGTIVWNGISCYKIVIDDPTFSYVDYVVKENDDLNVLADRKGINAYLVVDKNDNVKWFDKFPAGETVKLPSSYAKKSVLYIDKRNMLPIVQIMYDEDGQFEKYEYHDLKINPVFPANQFTEDFEGYNF